MDDTYGSSTALPGRTVLVAGATGGIGEGITRALLRQGARVVVLGRSAERLERLAEYAADAGPGELVTEVVDVSDPDSAAIRDGLLRRHGPADGAVISIGDWGPGGRTALLDTSEETWQRMIAGNLTSQFRALRALTPALATHGALIHLTGFSAELPYPYAALVGATNAAKKSLLGSLAAELDGKGPRIHELVIGPIRTRARAAAGNDNPDWYSGEDLGLHAALLIAGTNPFSDAPLQYLLDRGSLISTAPPAVA
ncbi:MAG: hypothetical protein QOF98_1689 [Streptomyces sp.]|nr:hypothetical protein [Streptomyces sp.]